MIGHDLHPFCRRLRFKGRLRVVRTSRPASFGGLGHYTPWIFACHYMNGPIQGYSKSELRNVRPDSAPDRGSFCQKCGSIVPVFTDLTDEAVRSLRELIANGRMLETMRIIQKVTECPLGRAKLWVNHPYGGSPLSQPPTPPCPSCGSQLRTPTARQCPKCFHSWHELA